MGFFSKKIKKIVKGLENQKDKSLKVEKDIKIEEKKKVSKKVVKKEYQDNKTAYKILIKPLISEKATLGVNQGKYVFEVSRKANKVEIKKAINEIHINRSRRAAFLSVIKTSKKHNKINDVLKITF